MSDVQILDITNDEYHKRDEWSSSQLKLLPDDPWLFYRRHIEKHPAFQVNRTASMKLGTAVHRIILDKSPVVMIPREVLRRQKKPKCPGEYIYVKAGDDWDAFEEEHEGSVLCKQDDPILYMVESIRSERRAMEWIEAEGLTEKSFIYRDEETGLALRSRLDHLGKANEQRYILLDLKSTKVDPFSIRETSGEAARYEIARQCCHYIDAVEKWTGEVGIVGAVRIVWTRNCMPWDCHVVQLEEGDLAAAWRQNTIARRDLADRLETNQWRPETWGMVTNLPMPEWHRKKHEQETEDYGD